MMVDDLQQYRNVHDELRSAFADRLRRHLGPYPHLNGIPESCYCSTCTVAALSDADHRWLQEHGWEPPNTEVTIYSYEPDKLAPPCVVVSLCGATWRKLQFSQASYCDLTIAATYIPRPGTDPMPANDWSSFMGAVSSMLIGDFDDNLAKLGGPQRTVEHLSVGGHHCTITIPWNVLVEH